MKTRVALIGIIVEDYTSTDSINKLLHENRKFIIGRMGIPYNKREVGIISVALDAHQDVISSLSGKLGMLSGVSTKTIYSKITGSVEND